MRIPKKIPPAYKVIGYVSEMAGEFDISVTDFLRRAQVSRTTVWSAQGVFCPIGRGIWLKIVDAYQRLKDERK